MTAKTLTIQAQEVPDVKDFLVLFKQLIILEDGQELLNTSKDIIPADDIHEAKAQAQDRCNKLEETVPGDRVVKTASFEFLTKA